MKREQLIDLLVGENGDRDICAEIVETCEELREIWHRDGPDAAQCLHGIYREKIRDQVTS